LARTNHESLKPSRGLADRLTIGGGNCLSTAMSSQKVTFSHCVPPIIHMLVSSPVIKNLDLSRWKVVIGGSALSQGLCKAGLENGINLYTAYGMSETCPLLTVANLKPHMLAWDVERQVEMRCRRGLPVPNVLLEVVDTDRVKDVIKTGGEWISSLALEDLISRHPAVSEAAVIGVPDPKWGERPMALVVLKPGAEKETSPEDLKAFFVKFAEAGVIPKYGVPDRVNIVETSVGKINKKQLRIDYK